MKKLVLLAATFTLTPLVIFISIIFLSYLIYLEKKINLSHNNSKVAYAALPSTENLLRDRIIAKDGRVEVLEAFFKKYKSELAPYAKNIVASADKYNLDYRLIPAIAMQESNLCKKAPKNSHNCWGYAIYGKNVKKFANYTVAIDAVSHTLSKDYKKIGLVTPDQIMTKYTPSNNGSWARGVSHFMTELENIIL